MRKFKSLFLLHFLHPIDIHFSVSCSNTGDRRLVPLLQFRHESLQRNKRCLLAYLYNRLQRIRQMRWQFGATLPDDIKATLCEPEIQWVSRLQVYIIFKVKLFAARRFFSCVVIPINVSQTELLYNVRTNFLNDANIWTTINYNFNHAFSLNLVQLIL